ncbi:MAG: hydroxymethylbilane synthase [Caulobacterales bacterium]
MAVLLRIGARGSALSLAQTGQVRALLASALDAPETALEIVPITTSGDRIQDRRLIDAGGKGLFTKELDEALLGGRIDCAVHSLKDLPTHLPQGITLASTPMREDVRDAFISNIAERLEDLPEGARVGTASLRRQAQILAARPDLKIVTLRGNVETRLKKIADGEADATFLALAGLKRLGLESHARSIIDPDQMPPAAGQGALAITARADDEPNLRRLQTIEDTFTRMEAEAERAFIETLDGSCRTPFGALARAGEGALSFVGEALTPDGKKRWRQIGAYEFEHAGADGPASLGKILAQALRRDAGDELTMDVGD